MNELPDKMTQGWSSCTCFSELLNMIWIPIQAAWMSTLLTTWILDIWT